MVHVIEGKNPINSYTVEPLWKGQESLTQIAKFGQFPYAILYKSCLFYPSWQATSFERPPYRVAFIEGFYSSQYHSQCLKLSQKSCRS